MGVELTALIQMLLLATVVLAALPGSVAPASAAQRLDEPDSVIPAARSLQILPIIDGRPTPERVQTIFDRLGRGGPFLQVGFSAVFRYLADTDPSQDFQIVPTRLEEIAAAARAAQAPFLVHLNGGRWAGGGPLLEMLARDHGTLAWDQHNRPWLYLIDGEYHFSLSANNEGYRFYKERNLKAAAAWLAAFAAGPDGHLLVGVSTDSEVLLNLHPYYDYNPGALLEFADFLAGERSYGPDGRWHADGLGLSLREVNARYGTSFARWSDVQPPRQNDDSRFWNDWTTFRALLVDHSVQDQVDWIRTAGLKPEQIHSHQSPALNPDVFGDTLESAAVQGGRLGITAYGAQALSPELYSAVRALDADWGIFEYNPLLPDADASLAALDLLRSFAPRIVCPYHWDNLGGPNEVGYTIVGTPLEQALRTFVQLYQDQPLPR